MLKYMLVCSSGVSLLLICLDTCDIDFLVILCQINHISETSPAHIFDFVHILFWRKTNINSSENQILNIMNVYLLTKPLF